MGVYEICRRIGNWKEETSDSRTGPAQDLSADNLSPQALEVHKLLYSHVDYLKKQQWITTNYVSIIYGAIFAVARDLSLWQRIPLVLASLGAACCGVFLLCRIRYDLGGARIRVDKANLEIFGKSEWDKLGMAVEPEPYRRGAEFTYAMVSALAGGGLLLSIYLLFSSH